MAPVSVFKVACSSNKNIFFYRWLYPTLQCFCTNHHKYSTATQPKETPVKYTTSKASQLDILTTLNLNTERKISSRSSLTISICLTVLLFYIMFFREENDIDEIIKGNPEYQNDYSKLQELKFQLVFCKNNQMPTEKIEKKISELCEKLNLPNQ